MSQHPGIDQAAAFALDALDPAERVAYEAHLAGCAECRAAVRSYREAADALAHAAPDATPAAGLRERVLAEARRARPLRRRPSTVPWLLAAASLIVALGVTLVWARDRARWTTMLAAARAELAARDSTLAALLSPEVHVVSLAATGGAPTVRVFWNHDRNAFIVTAFDLPAAQAGRTYQLWALARDRPPVSMGVFDTDAAGRAILVLPVDAAVRALGTVEACALTEEPAGGSAGPTETPRLVGTWRHAG